MSTSARTASSSSYTPIVRVTEPTTTKCVGGRDVVEVEGGNGPIEYSDIWGFMYVYMCLCELIGLKLVKYECKGCRTSRDVCNL